MPASTQVMGQQDKPAPKSQSEGAGRNGRKKSRATGARTGDATSAPLASAPLTFDTKKEGDLQIGQLLHGARAWYEFKNGTLSWREPTHAETNHLSVIVNHGATGRFIPGCKVTAAVTDTAGKDLVSTVALPLLWDAAFSYYGANINLPKGAETVQLKVCVDPPEFGRTDKQSGAFFTQPVCVTWNQAKVAGRSEPSAGASAGDKGEKASFPPGRHDPIEPTPYPGAVPKSR